MPRPGRTQVRSVISGGTPGSTAGIVSSAPTATQTKPSPTNRYGPHWSIRRACSHVATVQEIVVKVNTRPVSVAGVPRHVWSSSGMYASPLKNANVMTPRSSTAAGTPAASARVPGGVRRRNAGSSERDADDGADDDEAQVLGGERGDQEPGPGRREQGVGRAGGSSPSRRRAPRAGRRPGSCAQRGDRQEAGHGEERDQAEEHQPPRRVLADDRRDRRADHPGHDPGGREQREHPRLQPVRAASRPIATYAVGPMAPPPSPWMNRAPTRIDHRRRQPADQEPDAEQHEPDRERLPQRRRGRAPRRRPRRPAGCPGRTPSRPSRRARAGRAPRRRAAARSRWRATRARPG